LANGNAAVPPAYLGLFTYWGIIFDNSDADANLGHPPSFMRQMVIMLPVADLKTGSPQMDMDFQKVVSTIPAKDKIIYNNRYAAMLFDYIASKVKVEDLAKLTPTRPDADPTQLAEIGWGRVKDTVGGRVNEEDASQWIHAWLKAKG